MRSRFVVGYMRGIVQRRACPIRLYIKAAQSDKSEIYKKFCDDRARAQGVLASGETVPVYQAHEDDIAGDTSTLPPLKYISEDPAKDGWIAFEKPMCYMYAGQGPFVSKDLMEFPASLPNDGYIDVVVQERVSISYTWVSVTPIDRRRYFCRPPVTQ